MNIYFACSITGGREYQPAYQAMVAALLAEGHSVPTAHLADSTVASEKTLSPRQVYDRDAAWIEACDALVAEVSVPSHGVGYEVGYALAHDKPVLCLVQEGRPLSKMISGNPDLRLKVVTYCDLGEAIAEIRIFLAQLLL